MTIMERPLAGLRVVDLISGPLAPLDSITRYLAELGARVDHIEDTPNASHNISHIGKICHPQPVTSAMLHAADIIVTTAEHPLNYDALSAANPALIVMEVSGFGKDNSFSGWKTSEGVLMAMSGSLSRSGISGRAPLMPPGTLAWNCAAVQAAYLLLASHYKALRTGQGDFIDFSALDGAMQALDPGYGINGSATMGRPLHLLPRDRPAKGTQYPIFPCADGRVRICLLAPRQWQGMLRWMGEPEAFMGPEFTKISARQQSEELLIALAAFFATRTRAELEAEAQAHGVPLAGLASFREFAASDQLLARNALTQIETSDQTLKTVPNGVLTINGERMGPQSAADLTASDHHPATVQNASASLGGEDIALPFDGIKVLDLGVIVVGAEAGRMLADGGADVIKIESAAFPDGSRQSHLPYGLSASFAAGHRGKRSLGLDLRHEQGRALFLNLVAEADILLSNFKPGTLESLGFGIEVLQAVNPSLIMTDSSAFGSTGPWARRMGYGPLVRAASGLTEMWRYPDDPESFSDAVTVYPDHVAGRVSAMGTVALLIQRLRTGLGGTASVSQAEVMLSHFADLLDDDKAEAPETDTRIIAALGDDEWCVVSISAEEEPLLSALLGDQSLEQWIAARSPMDAATALQAQGIAAAPMLRIAELPDFLYCRERGSFRVDPHPYLPEPVTSEKSAAKYRNMAPPAITPAPLSGEHTLEIMEDWLNQSSTDVQSLLEAAVLQPTATETLDKIANFLNTQAAE
ncbi:MAG TPA: CoA transferase [Sphingopyxis sp.]|nr:CoA transferase [Sphingopyxis sp.]